MDAPVTATEIDLGATALKICFGIIVALIAAILYNFNERIMYLERNAITPDNLKENLREVITETERKHR